MGRKKKKKKKQPKKKRQRTRHGLIQRHTLNEPKIQNLVTDNERGGRSQNTDNMTEDQLLKYYSNILEGYSPIDYNSPKPRQPGSEAVKLARQRRHNNPKPKPINLIVTTPSDNIREKLSFDGGRKSKRRRKKKRRRTIKKKRKKRKKKN